MFTNIIYNYKNMWYYVSVKDYVCINRKIINRQFLKLSEGGQYEA